MNSKKFSSRFAAVAILVLLLAWRGPARGLSAVTADEVLRESFRARTVESLLHALPLELREDYVLGHQPLGAHVGHALRPRALLFGTNTIVSFGACPGSQGHDHLEIMDQRRLRPELIDVDLGPSGPRVHRNPESCRACHGPYNKPLWPSNAVPPGWPGFYAAGISKFTRPREDELLFAFKEQAIDHPRYGALGGLRHLENYGATGKILYESNKQYEEVLALTAARNAFGYLKAQRNFAPARLPLLIALNIFQDLRVMDVAPLFAPYVGGGEARVREALAKTRLGVSRAIAAHLDMKWRLLEHSLSLKISPAERGSYVQPRSEYLLRLATMVAWISEVFGLTELEPLLSTARRPGSFAFPGQFPQVGAAARLEQILFRDALAQTPLTAADVGREGWSSPRDLAAGIARLGGALGLAHSCDFLFQY